MSNSHHDDDYTAPALGGLLRLAWQEHRDRLYERTVAAGFPDVTRAHFALFRWPGIDGLRPIDLAEQVGLSKQTVNDLLGELERAGYLERRPHPHNRRARIVRLTKRGQDLQQTAHDLSRALEASWAATIGADRLATLRETLQAMVAHGLTTPNQAQNEAPPE